MLPTRPAANSTLSGRTTPRFGISTAMPSASRATSTSPAVERNVDTDAAQRRRRGLRRRRRSIIGTRCERLSTSVTSVPSARKIDAYSQPTAPPPMITRRFTGRSRSRTVAESTMSGSSKSITWRVERPRSGRDEDGFGVRARASCRRCVVTRTVRSGPSCASPWMSSMPCASMLARTSPVIVSTTWRGRGAEPVDRERRVEVEAEPLVHVAVAEAGEVRARLRAASWTGPTR